MERNAFPKQHVTPETVLYTVADLSTVWVMADVFEYEAANVRLNQAATLTLDYLPGRVFHGRVSYILPQVDPATRTLKVRIAFDNPGYVLKPDMYGQVEIHTGGARRLVVPRTAVLDSGDRQVVFVDRGNGNFEPRQVRVGEGRGDRVEILERPAGRRAHRHFGQLPDRFRKPVESGYERHGEMINRIIEFSARNRFLVLLLVAAAAAAGWWSLPDHSARRHSRPQRHPGDRLFALGPQPRHHRRPGDLPHRQRHAGRAAGEGRARLFGLRLLLRLHHFRRRHRHLLGALAHAGIPLQDSAAPAAGREDRAGAGRHRRGLGLSVRAGGHLRAHTTWRSCARSRTGFCATSCRPCRAWRKWHRWAASCGNTR